MTKDQKQRALEFIKRIGREVVPVDGGNHNGYHLRRPDGTHYRFGFVRYNISGSNKGKYCVQVIGSYYDDPRSIFRSIGKSNVQCYVAPGDEDGVRYAVSVLESCYDNGR